jgi:ATP synthase protein I
MGGGNSTGAAIRQAEVARKVGTVIVSPALLMKPVEKYQGMGRATIAGCDMVAAVGVGALIGWWLDKVTGWWPWCFLVFFILGTAAGMRMVYVKMMAPMPNEKEKK